MKNAEIATHVIVNLFVMAGLLHWQQASEEPMSPVTTAAFMSIGVACYWTFKSWLERN